MSSMHKDTGRPDDVQAVQRPLMRNLHLVFGALAASLLTAGLGLGAFLVVESVDYDYWLAAADFNGDENAHEVALESGETFLLWKHASFDTPECSVRALPSGDEVLLDHPTTGRWNRGAGAVPYVAFAEGRTDSTRVSVTCASTAASAYDSGEPDTYYIDRPHGPAFFDSPGPWWPAPFALIAAGLVLLALAVARAARARRAGQRSV